MALGLTIRRWHVILAAGLLLYNIYSCKSAKLKQEGENQATYSVLKQCFGKSPKAIKEILKNPKDAYRFASTVYPDEDCVPVSIFYQRVIDKDKYSPKILTFENIDFRKKYPFEFHNICTFNECGRIGSVDNIFGYIEPQDSTEDIVKIIENKAGIKNSKYYYSIYNLSLEEVMHSMQPFPIQKE